MRSTGFPPPQSVYKHLYKHLYRPGALRRGCHEKRGIKTDIKKVGPETSNFGPSVLTYPVLIEFCVKIIQNKGHGRHSSCLGGGGPVSVVTSVSMVSKLPRVPDT